MRHILEYLIIYFTYATSTDFYTLWYIFCVLKIFIIYLPCILRMYERLVLSIIHVGRYNWIWWPMQPFTMIYGVFYTNIIPIIALHVTAHFFLYPLYDASDILKWPLHYLCSWYYFCTLCSHKRSIHFSNTSIDFKWSSKYFRVLLCGYVKIVIFFNFF